MGQFKKFVLQEGEIWDAVVHGVDSGFKEFQKKRKEQKEKTEQKKLSEKIIDVDKKEIKDLVKQIVSNGYTISNGEVKECRGGNRGRPSSSLRIERSRMNTARSNICEGHGWIVDLVPPDL